jgi:hypothetical protein
LRRHFRLRDESNGRGGMGQAGANGKWLD